MLIFPTETETENHFDRYCFVKVNASVLKLSDRFVNSWVFICLAASSGRDVECQTRRHSPLKRDDCAVSGWMTMAPSASGLDRLECRRRCGRLQSLELVLCECSRAEPLHPTIATDQRTAAGKRRKNEQRCKIWCKACINLHPPDISINDLMTHKVIKNSHLSFLPSLITMVPRNLMNGNEERILDGLNKQLSFCTTQDVLCTKSGARQLASSTSTAYLNNFTMLICCLHLFTVWHLKW